MKEIINRFPIWLLSIVVFIFLLIIIEQLYISKIYKGQPLFRILGYPGLFKQGAVNLIEFDIKSPKSPKKLGLSKGKRELGFGFRSVTFQ